MEISGLGRYNNCNEKFIRGTQQIGACSRISKCGDQAITHCSLKNKRKKQLQWEMEHQHV